MFKIPFWVYKAFFTLGGFARAIGGEKIAPIHLAEETYGTFHTIGDFARAVRVGGFLSSQARFALAATLGTRSGLQ